METDPSKAAARQPMLRSVTAALHRLDFALGRLARTRRVLVEIRTPVYRAVLGPIIDALRQAPGIEVLVTSEDPDAIRHLVPGLRVVGHEEAAWMRFALYVNADPWAAARLRRCERRINFFHGVAGKYDLDSPRDLPMGFDAYDRVAFINRDRMHRYLDAGIVTRDQAVLVGYPKLDRLARGAVDGAAVRRRLALDPSRRTALYAPTYSTASSLHLAGEAIVRELAAAGLNVIVKLHDRSLDRDPRYNGGIDWRARMTALERPGQIVYLEAPDASDAMAAADVMVTDHSSVGFEYLVRNRPLIVFDAPDLAGAARINPEKIALLRSAAIVVGNTAELGRAVRRELEAPERLANDRARVADEMFHAPGSATDRSMKVIHGLLGRPARSQAWLPTTRENGESAQL